MTLYELMKITEEDYDTYDNVFDGVVTVCYIDEDDEDYDNDDYNNFCIGIVKKIEVVDKVRDGLVCKWSDMIIRNMDKFKDFTEKYWRYKYRDDDDEFIYQWINKIHSYMAGYVSEDFYTTLVEFVNTLD